MRRAIMMVLWLGCGALIFANYRVQQKINATREHIAAIRAQIAEGEARSTARMIHQAGAEGAAGVFIIHRPESGCPVGWTDAPELFTQKDGSHKAGCYFRAGQTESGSLSMHVDYLLPGESMGIGTGIPLDDAERL